jgi:hypothetical protein
MTIPTGAPITIGSTRGTTRRRPSTEWPRARAVWVEWEDGSASWAPMSALEIQHDPACSAPA